MNEAFSSITILQNVQTPGAGVCAGMDDSPHPPAPISSLLHNIRARHPPSRRAASYNRSGTQSTKGRLDMSTASQIANAANAQLSTGPRTDEGKRHSSQNARTHGLTAQQPVIPDEDRAAFDQLRAQLC